MTMHRNSKALAKECKDIAKKSQKNTEKHQNLEYFRPKTQFCGIFLSFFAILRNIAHFFKL